MATATAEIPPVVSAERLRPGSTLTHAERKTEPFLIPGAAAVKGAPAEAKIRAVFTQSPPSVTVTTIAEIPSARPQAVLFGALANPYLRLRKPIPLAVSEQDGHVVLTWEATDEFACGANMGEAMDDFAKTVSELFTELNSADVKLGEDLKQVRVILNEYIEPRKQER